MHQPATTNPLIIMCINMTIVFAVLIGLSFMIKFIHMIDPTKPKEKPAEAPKAAPAAAPAAAAPAEAAPFSASDVASKWLRAIAFIALFSLIAL